MANSVNMSSSSDVSYVAALPVNEISMPNKKVQENNQSSQSLNISNLYASVDND